MKRRALMMTGAGIGLALFGLVFSPMDRLIWNRTGSAPQGLYWLSDEPITHGRWVVVSARSAEAQWAEDHGFVGRNWPLLKQIAGLPGDEICRCGAEVSINGKPVAMARERDSMGRALPVWQGCVRLDEGQVFLLVEDFDGRFWHVPAGAVDMAAPPSEGAVVELKRASAMVRASDRAIASVADAAGGIWSEELHARHDPGSKPDYRLSLKRRLEALRRAGIGARLGNGEWQVDGDFLQRAAGHEAQCAGGVRLAVLSWTPLDKQVSLEAETWLDGVSDDEASVSKRLGDARTQRQAWLREQAYLGEGQDRLSDDQRARLRRVELTRASAAIAARSNREALTLRPGDGFEGTLEGHVDLAQGRMAIIGNAKEFTLVPWREALGRQIGRELSIQRTARGVSWSLGMERSRGLSR